MQGVEVSKSRGFVAAVITALALLEFSGLYISWGLWLGSIDELQAYLIIIFIIAAILYLYVLQSDRRCIVRSSMDKTLGELKIVYLNLHESNVREKKALEEVFHQVALNRNIHPRVNPEYKPKIKTTINLSGFRVYTEFRDLQRQMRIDAIFLMNSQDQTKIGSLIGIKPIEME